MTEDTQMNTINRIFWEKKYKSNTIGFDLERAIAGICHVSL